MKFLLFSPFFFLFFILSASLSTSLHRKKKQDDYGQAKQIFLTAAALGGGQYIEHSWNQADFIERNTAALAAALQALQKNKASSVLGLNVDNLKAAPAGVCAGMSIYFLNVMKVLREQTPHSDATARVNAEIPTLASQDVQNTFYMNALELHNIYKNSDLNAAARTKNLEFVEGTRISKGATSTIGETTRDVDIDRQAKDIHDWIKARHSQSSYFIVEFKKHATAYVRIGPNLKFFFDPNFGIVKFTSIEHIDRFLYEILNARIFQGHYMIPNDKSMSLKAYR